MNTQSTFPLGRHICEKGKKQLIQAFGMLSCGPFLFPVSCGKFLVFVCIMLVSFSRQAAAVVKTFGSPAGSSKMSDRYTSSASYFGVHYGYKYSTGAAIYGKDEIGLPGTITSYAVYKDSGPTGILDSTYIFMKEVGTTTAVSSPLSLEGYTLVFKGAFENSTASGWQTVTLTNPFNYTYTGNLSIVVTSRRSASSGTYQYYFVSYASGSAYNTAYKYSSTATWSNWLDTGSTSPSAMAVTTTSTYRPYMQFNINPPVCTGTPVAGSAVAASTTLCAGREAKLSLKGGTLASFTYSWDTSATGLPGSWALAATVTSYPGDWNFVPPAGRTLYYRCRVSCPAGGSLDTSTSVSVSVSSPLTPPYTETFEGVTPGVNPSCAAAYPFFSDGVTTYTAYYSGDYQDYWKVIDAVSSGYSGSNYTPSGKNYLVSGYNVGYDGTYAGQAGYWFTPPMKLEAGKNYRFSYWYRVSDYVTAYYADYGVDFGMYYGKSQSPTGLTVIKPDINKVSSSTYQLNSGDFTVPADGIYFVAAKANVSTATYAYYGAAVFDDFNLQELPLCSTLSSAAALGSGGDATITPNTVCSLPATVSFSLVSTPPYTGLTFEWEVASGTPTSFTSTGVTGTSGSLSLTAGGLYYYRCKVTCTATGFVTYSDTESVRTVPITPPYVEDFEKGTSGTNLPCAGSTYWGRVPYYWNIAEKPYVSAPNIRNHTAGGSKYLHAGYYLGYNTGQAEYWFTPALALTAAKAYNVSYWYSNSGYYPSSYASYATEMGIYAGTAQTAAAMTIKTGDDTTIYINATTTPTYDKFERGFIAPTTGTYYVGIKVDHKNYSYYGFAIDDIGVNQLPPCSARPAAGAANASPSLICSSGTSTVSLKGISLASDLSFQWQVSATGLPGSYSNISGANLPAYTTGTLSTGPWYYRCIVICGAIAAPNADTSVPAKVSVGGVDLPYVEDFETGITGVNMLCASYSGTWNPTSLSYWNLRSGAYSTSYPGIRNHTPGGKNYIYSGYYNGPYYSSGDQFYWFTPALKMTGGKGYKVGFWFNGTGYNSGSNGLKIGIYAGTTQSAAGMTIRAGGLDSVVNGASSTYAQMVRSFVAPATGNYYVGIKTSHTGYNYPGIPIDDINIEQMPDCSGKPVAGVPDAYPYLVCASGTTTFRLPGTSVASGIQYQWQVSTAGPGGPWANATGGTGATAADHLTPTLTATRWYRCIVTCSVSGLSDTSSVGVINVGAITPPYTEDFERAIVGVNVPCAAVFGTWAAASTYNYWTIKGARLSSTSYPAIRNITPGGSQYLYAGYYPGWSASPYYWFTPTIKLTAGESYEFSYWYSGSGYSGGATTLGMYYGTAQTVAAMTTTIRPDITGINSGTAKQILGRFVAPSTGNFYMGIKVAHTAYTYSGIALDDIGLNQLPPCTGAPTAGAISSTVSMLCTPGTADLDMDFAGISKAAGLSYRWYSSTTSATAGFTPMSAELATPPYTTPMLSATTWFYCVVKCTLTGDSVISSLIKVDVGAVTPPYIETFETVTPGKNAACASYTGSWSSSPYWYTYGSPYSSSYPSLDNHTPGGSRYLLYGYNFWYSYGASQYWFSPAIQLKGGSLYQLSFWYNGSGYSGGKTDIRPYIGTAQTAAAMTTALGAGVSDVTNIAYKYYKYSFAPTSSGNYYLGLNVTHTTYNYPGIVIDDIGLQEVPPCSAPVTAGTIVAEPEHICAPGGSTVLDLEGATLATGLSYEWQASSSPAGPFTATGGTALSYNTDPLMANTWFRVIVTCSATGITDTSAPIKIGVGGMSVPYKEDFEKWSVAEKPLCSDATYWGSNDYDGYKVKADPAYNNAYNNTPGGAKYMAVGYYLGYSGSYSPLTNDNFWFSPGLFLDNRYKYAFSYYYVGGSNSVMRVSCFYGTAQNPAAMTHLLQAPTLLSGNYERFDTVFKPAVSGTYYLGFKKTNVTLGTYYYSNVGIDDINLNYAPCDGMPSAGHIRGTIGSGTALCVNTFAELVDTGATVNLVPGIRYQWMRRSIGSSGAWSAVAGATDSVLKADTLIGYEYKFAVVCSNTNDTAFSSVFQLPAEPPHPVVSITPSSSPVSYCLGDTVRFNATGFTGAVYDWMIDSVVQYGWKFSDMGATEPGEYMVRVTSPLSPCPAYSNRVKLEINEPGYAIEITKPADSIICEGGSLLLTAIASKPGVTIRWRKDNVDIPFATGSSYLVTTDGYYRAVASDGVSLCPAVTRNIHIMVRPNPDAKITVPGGTLTACENEGVVLKANPGYSYEWQRGGSTISGAVDDSLLVKNSGSYSVKVRTADGCMDVSSSVTVNILPSPVPVITKTVLGSGSIELSTTTFLSYQWYRNGVKVPGATSQKLGLLLNGIYKVVVTGTNSCEGTSEPIELNESTLGIVGVQTEQIRIYPNPTQSKVFIESPVAVQVSVKDITGKTVLQSQEVKEVDLSKYADGVYLFTISDKDGNELIRQQRVTKFTK